MRSIAAAAVVALACTALLAWTQFSFEGLLDSDSYFHTRVARELAEHGIQRTFPQTVFSTWSTRYSDKDLLLHLTLIPFQFGAPDLVVAGKRAVVFLDLLLFAGLAASLFLVGARRPALWLLLFFVADAPLLYPLLLARPGLLGVTFVIVEIGLLMRGRERALGVVGFLHALAHSSFVLLPILGAAFTLARWLRREPLTPRLLAVACAAPLGGLVLNPYFPNSLTLAWDQLVEVAGAVWWKSGAIPPSLFGSELLATRTDLFLGSWPVYLPAIAGIVAFLTLPRQRLSTAGLGLLLASGVLLVLGFLSERFLHFFFPVALLLGARVWSELRRWWPRSRRTFLAMCAICLLGGLSDASVVSLRRQVQAIPTAEVLRPAIRFLDAHAQPSDLVYHNFWFDFSALYHFRPRGRYVVALDPVFFYRHDPARFRLALEAFEGRGDAYRVLTQEFEARWIFLPKAPRHLPLFELLRRDGRFDKAYEDEAAVILRPRGTAP